VSSIIIFLSGRLRGSQAARRRLFALSLACAAGCSAQQAQVVPELSPVPAEAQEQEIAQLEKAFWACDYVATTRGVLATPMAACQHATNELKRQKFRGSARAMTAWWQENKAAEHARMEQAAPALPAQ
jgi:hypothetical protein